MSLEAVHITPGCVPGIDHPTLEQEIEPIVVGDQAHIYVPCECCSQTYVNRWPVALWERYGTAALYRWSLSVVRVRLCPACDVPTLLTGTIGSRMQAHAESQIVNSVDISDGDTQPLDLPARPPKLDTSAFFRLLDEDMANAFQSLEQDSHVILRGHRDALETIRRYVVNMQEQTGFLQYQVEQMRSGIEQQKEFAAWWKREAERYQAVADRHAASLVKMADAPAPAADPGLPHLSLVDVEILSDLAKKHTGATLAELLDTLRLPVLDEFQASYPVIHEAKAAIGKRIVDYGYSVIAYHVAANRTRGGRFYLTLDFGFGSVNVFDRDIKERFIRYPGGYDEWLAEGFELALDPPVLIQMSRDAKNYARLDDLHVVE